MEELLGKMQVIEITADGKQVHWMPTVTPPQGSKHLEARFRNDLDGLVEKYLALGAETSIIRFLLTIAAGRLLKREEAN